MKRPLLSGGSLEQTRREAEKGNPDEQCYLGIVYSEGEGVSKDFTQAVSWLLQAAEQGHEDAQFRLGVIYSQCEDGVPQDVLEAFKWFQLAAQKGDPDYEFKLGILYATGFGTTKNPKAAIKLFRLSAQKGNYLAKLEIAKLVS